MSKKEVKQNYVMQVIDPLTKEFSVNICHLLSDREHGIDRRVIHPRSSNKFCLDFFKCIPPNLSICGVEKNFNFIRKFSPDGKYLLCFSKDQLSIENYKFLGTPNANSLLYDWKTEYIPSDLFEGHGQEIRRKIFDKLFKLRWTLRLTTSYIRPLYREFSIFTDDGKYIIIASHAQIPEDSFPSYYTLNSIVPEHLEFELFVYRFYMIEIATGKVTDVIDFKNDYIKLSHNFGVTLRGNLFVVTSLLHQAIHVVNVIDGKFGSRYIIGQYPHGSEECICTNLPEYETCCRAPHDGSNDFKQKILIFLYKKVLDFEDDSRPAMIKMFYQRLFIYEAMQLFKVQFLDEDHLLIRYDMQDHPKVNTTEKHKLFVVYNLPNDEIIRVSGENAADLLCYFLFHCDTFRNARSPFTGQAPSSSGNSIQILEAQTRVIRTYPRGYCAAAVRLLPQLPLSVQSYAVTPFLDMQLFQYDTTAISCLERPRWSHCQPIKFHDRNTDVLLFRMHLNYDEDSDDEADRKLDDDARELVAFVFHPFEPFFISVQKLGNQYSTNFHIRNEGTIVKKD